ncbi:uncharacterized protein LOC112341757 isoform X1 [Selaginella moellendorffii]|uniref:uncharacterized protein LOC112341757 isoform X1 n=1 Tax=Selaginella moellendorffii TaxID=88036 RepID=UPI000D1D0AF8|nr:uncharacterized protein LOC112341757 isoform X1 [Selaginella moellendorffii]|eukprot:XP_024518141.1 uncharacterized protein LOC112341757 isoform X1 [Selaginella moellendorffii]
MEDVDAGDALDALLFRLVDNQLHDLSKKQYPDYGAQLVAKQLEAVAWLYYFYLHKSFPELEYYDPLEFCRKTVFFRLGLAHYVKPGRETDLAEARVQAAFSAAEGAATGDTITRVAVLLLSKDRKSCLLVKSLITAGLWSFVEKEVADNGDPLDCAYSAVRENVEIEPGCVQLEQRFHHFRAMSQKGDNTRLYIMVCEDHVQPKLGSGIEDFEWMPLESLFLKAKGDFISSYGWEVRASQAVDYLHIYPLVDYLQDFLRNHNEKGKHNNGTCQIEPTVRAAVEANNLNNDLGVAVEVRTQNCTEVNVKITGANVISSCSGKKRGHEEEKLAVATLVVPDSDDDENHEWSAKKSCTDSQVTQNSLLQLSSSSPNPRNEQPISGLKKTSPASKPSKGDGGKQGLAQTEAPLDDKEGIQASQNESSNGGATLTYKSYSHEETLEQLQAKHLGLLLELKNLTVNYELQVSTLLGKIAESSARLAKATGKNL